MSKAGTADFSCKRNAKNQKIPAPSRTLSLVAIFFFPSCSHCGNLSLSPIPMSTKPIPASPRSKASGSDRRRVRTSAQARITRLSHFFGISIWRASNSSRAKKRAGKNQSRPIAATSFPKTMTSDPLAIKRLASRFRAKSFVYAASNCPSTR